MKLWLTPLIQLLVATILSYVGYWYILALSALVLGVVDRGNTRSVLVGLASAVAVGIIIVINASSGGIVQAALFSRIVGIPGGAIVPLILTLIYSFALGSLGYMAGGSVVAKKD
mgnify:CR=1 FL=1